MFEKICNATTQKCGGLEIYDIICEINFLVFVVCLAGGALSGEMGHLCTSLM